MTVNFRAPDNFPPSDGNELKPTIMVLGVGGAGGNAVNNMINANLQDVTFVVANTDAQALAQSKAERKIQLGAKLTRGLGAGAKPEVGKGAAEESLTEILESVAGANMVFVTAGMGGGTGTGAAPVIARAIREKGILTVGVITKPFQFEGDRRMKAAERGIKEMQQSVDTLIVIPNQNLFRVATDRTTFAQAFAMADDVLHSGVRGIKDLIVVPGLINRDFADIETVMTEMGKAMMGTGEMEGEGRALRAAEAAISNPLLDDVSMKGARAILVNVTGGSDLMLFEMDEAVNRIRAEVDPDANILVGSTLSENMEGRIRVSVVATGIDADSCARLGDNVQKLPVRRRGAETDVQPSPLSALPNAGVAPVAISPVHLQVTNLLDEFAREAVPEESVDSDVLALDETMELGGAEAPLVEEAPVQQQRLNEFAPQHIPQQRPRRRFFGLFGGRPKAEITNRVVEPPMDRARMTASSQAKPAAPAMQMTPVPQVQAAKQNTQQAATPLRVNDERSQPKGRADDLFAGVSEGAELEIPAFLRQKKSGS